MDADDVRICRAPELAKEQGKEVSVTIGDIDSAHPNTVRVTLTDANGSKVSLLEAA